MQQRDFGDIELTRQQTGLVDSFFTKLETIYSTNAAKDRGLSAFYLGEYYKYRNRSVAKEYYNVARENATTLNDDMLHFELLFVEADERWRERDLRSANHLFFRIREHARSRKRYYLEGRSIMMLAIIALSFGSNETGIEYLNQSL